MNLKQHKCKNIKQYTRHFKKTLDLKLLILSVLTLAFFMSFQLFHRSSSREFIQVITPLFQKNLSFREVMAAASSLVCGYTEGAFSRVTSFNWYEDNNYKVFLGISSGWAKSDYTYDNSTSESITCFSNITHKDTSYG